MKVIESFIENLYTGEPAEFRELRVTPVFVREESELPFLEFEAALRAGLVEVTEVSEGGSVPTLRVENRAERGVLILDGEMLVGARQNRIVNTTVVVPARSSVEIPVTCVEQGRWSYTSRRFDSSDDYSYSSLRRLKHDSVTQSLRRTGRYTSDQSAVWADIRAKSGRLAVESPTMSLADVYESSMTPEVEAQLDASIGPLPGQVGYLAYVRGGFAGGDVFGSAELCRAKLSKLLRGHLLDALDAHVEFPRLSVEQVIGQVRSAAPERFDSVGEGSELRFETAQVQGAWKVVGETVPHLMVFPKLN